MKTNQYAIYYGLLALLLLLAGCFVPFVVMQVLIFWGAASVMVVAVAYGLNRPHIFRKRADGRIPLWIRWLFIPFLTFVNIYNWSRLKADKELPLHKIGDNLYLGSRLTGMDLEQLKAHKISAIVDVTAEFDAFNWRAIDANIRYLNMPVLDHAVPSLSELKVALRWLHNQIKRGEVVLIHCALGRGRSFLLVLAYLLSVNPKATLDSVTQSVQSHRKKAKLNRRQVKTLKKWHDQGELNFLNNLWIFYNPKSGGGRWQKNNSEIKALLSPFFNLQECELTPQKSVSDWFKELQLQEGDRVVACGGDGTVAAVACALVNTPIELAIIPMGTANALAKRLFGLLATDVETACSVIISSRSRWIDTAVCNDKPFLLLAAVGFEQQMVSKSEQLNKDTLGQLAYLQGLWQALNENTVLSVTFIADDNPPKTIQTPSFVVANLAPVTSILALGGGEPIDDDGLLDVTWLNPGNGIGENVLRLAELAIAGVTPESRLQQFSRSAINHRTVKSIKISVEGINEYVLDGEICRDMPMEIRVAPKSLLVSVPSEP